MWMFRVLSKTTSQLVASQAENGTTTCSPGIFPAISVIFPPSHFPSTSPCCNM